MPQSPPRLLAGPYTPPPLRRGDRTPCLYHYTDVTVTSWTSAPIPWPRCCPPVPTAVVPACWSWRNWPAPSATNPRLPCTPGCASGKQRGGCLGVWLLRGSLRLLHRLCLRDLPTGL